MTWKLCGLWGTWLGLLTYLERHSFQSGNLTVGFLFCAGWYSVMISYTVCKCTQHAGNDHFDLAVISRQLFRSETVLSWLERRSNYSQRRNQHCGKARGGERGRRDSGEFLVFSKHCKNCEGFPSRLFISTKKASSPPSSPSPLSSPSSPSF